MNPPADEPLPPIDPASAAGTGAIPRSPPSPSFAFAPVIAPSCEAPTTASIGGAESAGRSEWSTTAAELAEWKDGLRRDFETWLAAIETIPTLPEATDLDGEDAPALYAFYEELVATSAESRKANRRTAEAMSQWGETLARFEGSLQPLREAVAQLAATQPKAGRLARAQCLVLVELLDRMHRLEGAFASPPVAQQSWWRGGKDRAWREAWEAQHQAFEILVGHLEALLVRHGVSRIATEGQPFDPRVMMAVAAEASADAPAQTVVEEVAAGYLLDDELLRPAQVKVAR